MKTITSAHSMSSPNTNPDYDAYRQRLEELCQPGGLLALDSPYATATWTSSFSDAQKTRMERVITRFLAEASHQADGYCLLLTGGAPGSGKSSLLKRAEELNLDLADFLILDPDRVRELLLEDMLEHNELPIPPELANGINGLPLTPNELASLVHCEASRITNEIRRIAIMNRWNFVYDSSLRESIWTEQLLETCKQAGYFQREVVVADASLATVLERADTRWLDERKDYDAGQSLLGGRFVPAALIASQFNANGKHASIQIANRLTARGTTLRTVIADTTTGQVVHDTDNPPKCPTWRIQHSSATRAQQRACHRANGNAHFAEAKTSGERDVITFNVFAGVSRAHRKGRLHSHSPPQQPASAAKQYAPRCGARYLPTPGSQVDVPRLHRGAVSAERHTRHSQYSLATSSRTRHNSGRT